MFTPTSLQSPDVDIPPEPAECQGLEDEAPAGHLLLELDVGDPLREPQLHLLLGVEVGEGEPSGVAGHQDGVSPLQTQHNQFFIATINIENIKKKKFIYKYGQGISFFLHTI